MTVIAWDGTMLAADKRAVYQGLIRTVTKIRRIGDLLVGASGDAAPSVEAMDWVARGRKPDDFPERLGHGEEYSYVDMIVIDAGRILKYESTPFPIEIEDAVIAIGSGRDFALAAMHLGKTACEAVEVACLFEVGCGNGVDVLTREGVA